MFGPVRTYSDAFGYVRMRSEARCIFRICFANLLKFFQFSEVLVASGTCFDLFGPARMHSDAIGCIRKRSDGRVRAIYRRSPWCQKSPKSAKCALSRPHITTGFAGNEGMNIEPIESKKYKTPLLKELSQSSQDSFESESNPKESRDVRLNSFKSGIFHFCHF